MKYQTPQAFTDAVLGKRSDIDKIAGVQCVDLFKMFQQDQCGKYVATGNGSAFGYWTVNKDKVLALGFSAVTSKEALRPGDWVIFAKTPASPDGHVGMVTEVVKPGETVKLLAQNQAGKLEATIVSQGLGAFLGAFRLKAWEDAAPAPSAGQKPLKSNEEICREIWQGKWGNGQDRYNRLNAAGYNAKAIQDMVNRGVGKA